MNAHQRRVDKRWCDRWNKRNRERLRVLLNQPSRTYHYQCTLAEQPIDSVRIGIVNSRGKLPHEPLEVAYGEWMPGQQFTDTMKERAAFFQTRPVNPPVSMKLMGDSVSGMRGHIAVTGRALTPTEWDWANGLGPDIEPTGPDVRVTRKMN